MSQRDAILANIIEFSNNDWSIRFREDSGSYAVIFSQEFDSYETSSAMLDSIKESFKADTVTVEKSYDVVRIKVEGVPDKYFGSAFEKIEDSSKKNGEDE